MDELELRAAAADVIIFDLQWFAADDDGRTEKPTGKKLGKARDEGKLAKSQLLNQAVVLFVGYLTLYYMTGWVFKEIFQFTRQSFMLMADARTMSVPNFMELLTFSLIFVLKILGPFLAIAMLTGLSVSVAQGGVTWSFKPLTFDLKKAMPNFAKLFQSNLFSKQAGVTFLRTVGLLAIICLIEYYAIRDQYDQIPLMSIMSVMESVRFTMSISATIFFRISFAMVILGLLDYWFQHHEYIDSLKMRPAEVKDEHKQSEGDPQIKKKVQQRQFEMSMARMMKQVPKADVVITNPTHYAIALKYDQMAGPAPMVLAKGKNYLALKIKELAREHNIPIEENPPLARALYDAVEIGEMIPEEFFKAVAAILGNIMKTKKRRAAA